MTANSGIWLGQQPAVHFLCAAQHIHALHCLLLVFDACITCAAIDAPVSAAAVVSGEGRRPPMGDRPPRGPPREGGYREGYRSGPREGGGFGRGGGGDKVRAAGLRH